MTTWLITGCSTGLGRSLALAALNRGDSVVVTARDPQSIADIVEAFPHTALAQALDVTDDEQVSRAAQAAHERFGGVDVLVNNAGYGYRAAVEEGDDADVRRLFDTHFFGAVALIKAVLPGMRARRHGAIVNVSSIGATRCPEGSGYYSAAKSAMEGMSGSLRKELEPLGISVTIVEPGGFRTDFAGRSLTQSATPIADYAQTAGLRRIENSDNHGRQPGDPDKAAAAIITAMDSAKPPAMLLLGADALATYRSVMTARLAEADQWAQLSASTSYDS